MGAHHKRVEDLIIELSSDPKGLAEKEVVARIAQYGFNVLESCDRPTPMSIFFLGFLKNRPLFLAVMMGVILQMIVIYVPFLHDPFDIVVLKPWEWGVALLPGLAIFLIEPLRKLIAPTLFHYKKWTS